MLIGLLGIRLVLLVGDQVPLPASYDVVTALRRVEVTNDISGADGFQLTFALSRSAFSGDDANVMGALALFKRVIIGVVLGAVPEVLIDGVITHHQYAPGVEPGQATLTVMGKDVGQMLDLEERNEEFPNQPDSVIASRVILRYARYGLVPRTTLTPNAPIMVQRIPRQYETDLKLLQRLAQRNGYVFYVEPITFGLNSAYWGPENRLSFPQPALTMNMGSVDNVRSLSFSTDALSPVGTEGQFVEPFTKTTLPIPPLPTLRIPPLAAAPLQVRRTVKARDTANASPIDAGLSLLATMMSAPDPVTGEGEVDATRYGAVLRARRLVGVRGVGATYSGNWFVRRVTHTIADGDYSQRFTISREGTGALLPMVVP